MVEKKFYGYHANFLSEFSAYLPVTSQPGGILHCVEHDGKMAFWVSELAHSGEVVETGMYCKPNGVKRTFASVPHALKFLGLMGKRSR